MTRAIVYVFTGCFASMAITFAFLAFMELVIGLRWDDIKSVARLHRNTNMNWFGCLVSSVFIFGCCLIPSVFNLVYWSFHVGRDDDIAEDYEYEEDFVDEEIQ